MSTSKIIKDFIERNYWLKPKERLSLREEIRRIIHEKLSAYEGLVFNEPPFNPDLIGNILGIEFKESPLDDNISAELQLHPANTYKFLALINSLIDNDQHKRFSKFHEISHVLHNLFDEDYRAFRSSTIKPGSTFILKDPKEIVCDITSSEILFYNKTFIESVKTFQKDECISEQILNLSTKFNASIEATSRTLIESYPEPAFLMIVKEGYTKDEEFQIKANRASRLTPKPRILYAIVNDKIEFYIPKNKSFSEGTIVYKSLYNNSTEDSIVDLSNYKCGQGIYNTCVIPEYDRCLFIGFETSNK